MPENFILKSEVLTPYHEKIIEFEGKHPSRLLKEIPSIIKDVFKLTGTKMFEDSIKWDVSAPETDFYGAWRGKDAKDARTTVWAKVVVHGGQDDSKMGKATIWISGWVQTKMPYKSALDKMITNIYMRTHYEEQKRKYLDEAQRNFEKLENQIRALLEIMGRESLRRRLK